jgi:hypothetical protein
MEYLSWFTFLSSLASIVFASTCEIVTYVTDTTHSWSWCPNSEDNNQILTSLITLGLVGMIPSLIVLNLEFEELTDLEPYYEKFSQCLFILLWLKSQLPIDVDNNLDRIWVIFAYIGIESLADLMNMITRRRKTQIKMIQKLYQSHFLYCLCIKCLNIMTVYVILFKPSQPYWFLLLTLVRRLISRESHKYNESEHEQFQLFQWFAPILASIIVSYSSNSFNFLFVILALFELITAPNFYDSLPQGRLIQMSEEEERTMEMFETNMALEQTSSGSKSILSTLITIMTMPSHRATVVVGSVALCSMAVLGMSPVIIASFIYLKAPQDFLKLGLVFSFSQITAEFGVNVANRIHRNTGSLLRTGLILFWLCSLATVPVVFSYLGGIISNIALKEIIMLLCSATWTGAFTGLQAVENKIASEWTVGREQNDAKLEQRGLCSLAIIVCSFTDVMLASSLSSSRAIAISALFVAFCSLLGAGCYTVWFTENNRGPWRLVDGEGRELLRVTG